MLIISKTFIIEHVTL